jgi:hypothetical protein
MTEETTQKLRVALEELAALYLADTLAALGGRGRKEGDDRLIASVMANRVRATEAGLEVFDEGKGAWIPSVADLQLLGAELFKASGGGTLPVPPAEYDPAQAGRDAALKQKARNESNSLSLR